MSFNVFARTQSVILLSQVTTVKLPEKSIRLAEIFGDNFHEKIKCYRNELKHIRVADLLIMQLFIFDEKGSKELLIENFCTLESKLDIFYLDNYINTFLKKHTPIHSSTGNRKYSDTGRQTFHILS